LITALVLAAIARVRPELVQPEAGTSSRVSLRVTMAYGAVVTVTLALFASPLASRWPDGLDRTAEVLGFSRQAAAPMLAAPIPGYVMPGIQATALAISIAAIAGTGVAFVLAWLLACALVPRSSREHAAEPGAEP
ncbi:MAG TPA: PDGLE domain-containing protein, partial [Thermoanaerobaculaceae bacterium]|nr:PDGLE domain-containing protein [Thermoanaerobaculaceae bacterium]